MTNGCHPEAGAAAKPQPDRSEKAEARQPQPERPARVQTEHPPRPREGADKTRG